MQESTKWGSVWAKYTILQNALYTVNIYYHCLLLVSHCGEKYVLEYIERPLIDKNDQEGFSVS